MRGGYVGIAVRNLFLQYSGPAEVSEKPRRRNGQITTVSPSIPWPTRNIQFRLVEEPAHSERTPGNGNLPDVISGVYGTDVAENMVPFRGRSPQRRDESSIEVWGFTSQPHRINRAQLEPNLVLRERPLDPEPYADICSRGGLSLTASAGPASHCRGQDSNGPLGWWTSMSIQLRLRSASYESEVFGAVQKAIRGSVTSFAPIGPFQAVGGSFTPRRRRPSASPGWPSTR